MQQHLTSGYRSRPASMDIQLIAVAGCRMSAHARDRATQRSLSPELLGLLLDHGIRSPAGGGAEIVHLNQTSRRELAAEVDKKTWRRHADKLATAYVIIGANGTMVTAGHRFRRIARR